MKGVLINETFIFSILWGSNMKKISQVLRETTIPQVTGNYIQFDDNKELVGKCALGILACESPNEKLHLDYLHREVGIADGLLKTYGVEPMGVMIHLSSPNDKVLGFTVLDGTDVFKNNMMIGQIIVMLNDMWKLTFEEIGEFLEVTFDL